MATVIDELIVVFNLDASKFNTAQQDALAKIRKFEEESLKQAKGIEENGKRFLQFFQKLKLEALGALAAFAGAREIKEFVANLALADASLGRVARILNVSREDLFAWREAVKLMGGSAEDAQSSLSALSEQLAGLKAGKPSSELLTLMNVLGISPRNAANEIRNAGEMIELIRKRMNERNVSPDVAANFLRSVGIGPDTIQLLTMTEEKFNSLMKRARENVDVAARNADAAQESVAGYNAVSKAITDLGNVIAEKTGFFSGFAVVLFKIGDGIEWIAEKAKKLTKGQTNAIGLGLELFPSLFPGAGIFNWISSQGSGGTPPAGTPSKPSASLSIKPGAGNASPAVSALATELQSSIPGIAQFTAFNDPYHAFFNDSHAKGLALDFTLNDPKQSAAVAEAIRAKLKEKGVAANVIDEYLHPSPRSTGGHIHVGFASAAAAAQYQIGARTSAAISSVANDNSRSNTSSTDIHIGTVNVQADDVTKLKAELEARARQIRQRTAAAANTGPY